MKDIVCYVKLPNHIRQWLVHLFGNPVSFPQHSYELAVLTRVLQIRPKNVEVHLPSKDEVAIVIPDNAYRDPQYYNYLGRRGHYQMVSVITELFCMNLWSDLLCYVHNVRGINAIIDEWCKDHGIDVVYREAVRQRFYRMRKNKEALGVNLGKAGIYRQKKGGKVCNSKYGAKVSVYDVMQENHTISEKNEEKHT